MTLLVFIPASFALNLAPGPNNLMAMQHARQSGVCHAGLAGLGRLAAFSVMIGLAASGLTVLLFASEKVFLVVKVCGALYLFWLAFQLWRGPGQQSQADVAMQGTSVAEMAWREFLLAIGNPKAIVIFTAFLPQFINRDEPFFQQFLWLGGMFLILEWLAIGVYALTGAYLRDWFNSPRRNRLFNRTCATLLSAAGIGIFTAQKD